MNRALAAGYRCRDAAAADAIAVREMIHAVLREFDMRPDPQNTDADLLDLPQAYRNRGGQFWLLETADGELVGTLGLWPLDAGQVELRKMYLQPGARGKGLGKALLGLALEWARPRYRIMSLETASQLQAAIALYEANGFVRYTPAHLSCRCDYAYRLDLQAPASRSTA